MTSKLLVAVAATLCLGGAIVLASNTPAAVAVTTGANQSASLDSTGDINACASTGTQLTGTPAGNNFSNANYDGHGQTLGAGAYTASSNACFQNYIFSPNAYIKFATGPSSVTIVNNVFNGPDPSNIAINSVQGTNISINYNTFTGVTAASAFYYPSTNLTFDHNDIEHSPRGATPDNGADGVHFFFGRGGQKATNVSVSYNHIIDSGRYPIEMQYVVQGFKVLHNYTTTSWSPPELSLATGADLDGAAHPMSPDTTGVEVAYNIVLNKGYAGYSAGVETLGSGNNIHDNYLSGQTTGVIYSMTGESGQVPWHITNNTLVGVGSLQGCECFFDNVNPTLSGNTTYAAGDSRAPVPAWNYANGRQLGGGGSSITRTPVPTTSAPAPTTSAPAPTTSAPAPTTSAPAPGGTRLGTTTVGASTDNAGAGFRFGNIYTANSSGSVGDFKIYAGGHGGELVPVAYSVSSSGAIGGLVAYGAPVTLGANQSPGWITDKVIKQGLVKAGSKYLVGVVTKPGAVTGAVQLRYDSASPLTNFYMGDSDHYPAPAAAWGSGGGSAGHAGYSLFLDQVPPASSTPTTAPPSFSSPAPQHSVTTMGTTTVGRSADNPGPGYRFGNEYKAAKSGSLVDFKVYCAGSGGEFVPVLYQVTSAGAQHLVAYGNPVTLPVGQPGRWVTATTAQHAAIESGKTYLVGVLVKKSVAQSALTLFYGPGVPNNYTQDTGNSYPVPQATWASGSYLGTEANRAYSFYVDQIG